MPRSASSRAAYHGALLLAGHLPDLVRDAALEQLVEVVGVQVVRVDAEEEAVEDRVQRLVPGHLVRGGEDADERALDHLAPARELALVEQREQRIQDGAVRLEHLVEKDDLRLRQHARRVALVRAVAERGDVDRAEDLVGLREAREQVLEVAGLHQLGQGADERALGRARGPEQDAVLAGDDGDHQEADDLVLAEELVLERARQRAETIAELIARRSSEARRGGGGDRHASPACVAQARPGRRSLGAGGKFSLLLALGCTNLAPLARPTAMDASFETAGIGVNGRQIAMLVGALGAGFVCVYFVRAEKHPKPAARHAEHPAVTAVRPRPIPEAPRAPGATTASVTAKRPEAAPASAEMIPTREEWAEMAKTGATRFCLPVATNWSKLDDIPSAAAHAEELDAAYARSRQRLHDAFAPVCPEIASGGVPNGVASLTKCGVAVMRKSGRDGAKAARTEVDEYRGGLRPMPGANDPLKPEARVIMALTGEGQALVEDLSKTLGHDEAEKIVFREHGCAWQNGYEM